MLAERLAEAAMVMTRQPSVAATLQTICSCAVAHVGAGACGVYLVQGRQARIAATSDPVLVEAERVQLEVGEGPCLESLWQSDVCFVPDMRVDRRWPSWSPQMVELGWLSTLSVRLTDGDRTIGSLNLYDSSVAGFSEATVEIAQIFARHASIALRAAREEETLRQAVESRHTIGLAQGILMERYRLSSSAAFETLRRHSQYTNTKLAVIAAHVVDHRQLPPLQ